MILGTHLREPGSVSQEDAMNAMNRLSPRATVLSGATIGLIAGAAVYGAISSSASAPTPTPFKPAGASMVAPVSVARCAAGEKLEHGVCIVHVVRSVVAPAAGNGPSAFSTRVQESAHHQGASEAEHGDDAAEHAKEAAEQAHEAAEHAKETAEHTTTDGSQRAHL